MGGGGGGGGKNYAWAHQHGISIHNQDLMRESESGVISFIT